MSRIDAHHHLWRYSPEEYGWIDESLLPLRQDFLPDQLAQELASSHVDGTVAVQARQTVEETEWLLQLAGEPTSTIRGVVGWLPIAEPNFPQLLDRFSAFPALRGLRHVVQAEPRGFFDEPAFNRGIARLPRHGLVYDILIVHRQLDEATRFVDRHPGQVFVLDHLAKPDIRHGEIARWKAAITELSRRSNVSCKISGMVTEADPSCWTPEQLRPYFDVALDAFGPHRMMIGTDWPVLTVGCGYGQWWETVEAWSNELSRSEQHAILGETAQRVYRLRENIGNPGS
jgi:L-fuconolactonase